MPSPFLSIVIPAFNEGRRIEVTIEKVISYAHSKPFPIEITVVDDGSSDDTLKIVSNYPEIRILRNITNSGKGFSVRRGALEANGKFILFSDADLSSPIEEADRLLRAIEPNGMDVAIGSRAVNPELIGVHQPFLRELAGRCFNTLVRILTGLKLHDTQCGFKLFRAATTRDAFQLQRTNRFGFDPELLFIVKRLGGKIVEVPVMWNNDPASKVRLLQDSTKMFIDLIAIRWRALRGQYERK